MDVEPLISKQTPDMHADVIFVGSFFFLDEWPGTSATSALYGFSRFFCIFDCIIAVLQVGPFIDKFRSKIIAYWDENSSLIKLRFGRIARNKIPRAILQYIFRYRCWRNMTDARGFIIMMMKCRSSFILF